MDVLVGDSATPVVIKDLKKLRTSRVRLTLTAADPTKLIEYKGLNVEICGHAGTAILMYKIFVFYRENITSRDTYCQKAKSNCYIIIIKIMLAQLQMNK